jgi:hypothetical protein
MNMELSPEIQEYIIEQIRLGRYQIINGSVVIQILPDSSNKKYISRLPSGKWRVKAVHPVTRHQHSIGTWDTLEAAQVARDKWLREQALQAPVISLEQIQKGKGEGTV